MTQSEEIAYIDGVMQTGTLQQKAEAVLARFFVVDHPSELSLYDPKCPTDDFAWPLKNLAGQALRPLIMPLRQTPVYFNSPQKQKASGDKYYIETYGKDGLTEDGIAKNIPGMDDAFQDELRKAVANIAQNERRVVGMINPIAGATGAKMETARINWKKATEEMAGSVPLQVIRSTNREDIATVLKAFDLLAGHIKTLGVSTKLDQDLAILREHTEAMIKKAWTPQGPERPMIAGWKPQVLKGGMA